MSESERARRNQPRVFVYHGNLPPIPALALLAPLLLLLLSVAAAALAAGALGAFLLPLVFGRRWINHRRVRPDSDAIELSPDDYSPVTNDTPRLPRR
jgi:hypothetical protein